MVCLIHHKHVTLPVTPSLTSSASLLAEFLYDLDVVTCRISRLRTASIYFSESILVFEQKTDAY